MLAIGFRSDDDALVIDDDGVSRLHALLDGKHSPAVSRNSSSSSLASMDAKPAPVDPLAAAYAQAAAQAEWDGTGTVASFSPASASASASASAAPRSPARDGKERDTKEAPAADPAPAPAPVSAGPVAAAAAESSPPSFDDSKQTARIRRLSMCNDNVKNAVLEDLLEATSQVDELLQRFPEDPPVWTFARAALLSMPPMFARNPSAPPSPEEEAFSEWVLTQLLNRQAQASLEAAGALNKVPNASRLAVLRTEDDANNLLHAASLGQWGVHDSSSMLRGTLETTMQSQRLKPELLARFVAEHEEEGERRVDAATRAALFLQAEGLIKDLNVPTARLQPLHLFGLAHMLRRPIIVYGVEGDDARGIYLPVLCTHSCAESRCPRNVQSLPLLLCHTQTQGRARGHGSFAPVLFIQGEHPSPPLVPLDVMDRGERKRLPFRFLTSAERGQGDALLERLLAPTVSSPSVLQTLADGSAFLRVSGLTSPHAPLWKAYLAQARALYKERQAALGLASSVPASPPAGPLPGPALGLGPGLGSLALDGLGSGLAASGSDPDDLALQYALRMSQAQAQGGGGASVDMASLDSPAVILQGSSALVRMPDGRVFRMRTSDGSQITRENLPSLLAQLGMGDDGDD